MLGSVCAPAENQINHIYGTGDLQSLII